MRERAIWGTGTEHLFPLLYIDNESPAQLSTHFFNPSFKSAT